MRSYTVYKWRRFFRNVWDLACDFDLWLGLAVWIGIGFVVGNFVRLILAHL